MIFSWPNTEQFLLALLLFLPVLSLTLFSLAGNLRGFANWLSDFYYKISPWLFLVIFINLLSNIYPKFSPIFVNLDIGLGLVFGIDQIAIGFLIAINFIWLLFAFYSSQLFKLHKQYLSHTWQKFFLFLVSLLCFLFCSQSLITSLLFYQLLLH